VKYSVKMRAERNASHISGAEPIGSKNEIENTISSLMERTQRHPNDEPDSISIKQSNGNR